MLHGFICQQFPDSCFWKEHSAVRSRLNPFASFATGEGVSLVFGVLLGPCPHSWESSCLKLKYSCCPGFDLPSYLVSLVCVSSSIVNPRLGRMGGARVTCTNVSELANAAPLLESIPSTRQSRLLPVQVRAAEPALPLPDCR